ncbi:armadillo-like helical domain-containing protein 3 isoform X2 [Condylostylus longicornis]|uniref:armadillo-like helical domain-containing protein 3 isoform X2 n=1 Tax=Condylostylus longicornis TaxID=2530218 RepID=UPI00244E2CC0|nr:armadillo-like helical domain-containing protein 3 isoform X2 [Condylostylus longicornis]
MTSRKRSGSGSSKRPKEKVVYIYEIFLRGEDPTKDNPEFWNEFFLLQPNVESFENELSKLSIEQLVSVKNNLNLIFTKCIEMLESSHTKRIFNSLQTLCALFHSIFKRSASEPSLDVIRTIFEFEQMDENMKMLLTHCNNIMISDISEGTRFMCLKFILTLVTGTDNVSQNILMEYLMMHSLFDILIRLLSDSSLRAQHGHDIVVLLTLLVNYRKHEAANPYIVQLSILADELALNGYGQMISSSLIDFCRQYMQNLSNVQSSSWFSSLSNIVGNMFVSDEGYERVQQIKANNALLLALYEAVHLNRNFITTLAHTQTESSAPPSPSNTLNANQPVPDLSNAPILDITQYPSNLLVAVFQYCSIVMQDNKNESSVANLKLCFLILTCISEDQYANSIMHDNNLTYKVLLHRAQMRHRKLNVDRLGKAQPLAATLLDLLVEFIVSHLMKKFPMELYLLCIGVIHRILCYQKRCRIRLNYPWKELWSALIGLLRFLVTQEQNLVKKCNIFYLSLQVVNIFNLFITYGDTFLATTNSYDELYYELNREEKVFSEIHAMVLRYTTMPDTEYKDDVIKLMGSLVNILAIIKHFQNKIKEWLAEQGLSTPTEEQILEVVRKNYDLTLKLQDSLDHYERYSETPKHTAFFTSMVRDVVTDTRKNVYAYIKEAVSALPEADLITSQ